MRSHGSRGLRLPGGSVAQPTVSSRHSDTSDVRIVSVITRCYGEGSAHCSSRAPQFRRRCNVGASGGLLSAAAAAALTGLLVAVVQPTLAGAGEVVAHLVQTRLEALALYHADVGRGECQLQLLHCEHQVAPGDLILAHVEIRIAG